MSHEVVAGTGGAVRGLPGDGARDVDVVLTLGPHHPSTHGTLRLRLRLDGPVVAEAEPLVGHLHRGAEKLFEVRDYRQATMLANRHDWLAAFANELGVVLAVERLTGIEVPERAVWARTLMAELTRVLSHLVFLGGYPSGPDDREPLADVSAQREAVQAVMEELAGGRMHLMLNRPGGLAADLPLGWLDRVTACTATVRAALPALAARLASDATRERNRGVGRLDVATARAYAASGPVARASGVDVDLRRDDPYLAYASLRDEGVLRVVTREEGDCLARLEVLLEQTEVALDLVDACAQRLRALPPGPIGVRLPKVLRVPEGHTYAWTENPSGVTGYYLVSRGEPTPWRLKLRTPGFAHTQLLGALLPGTHVGDLPLVLASLFLVVGDVDK